MKKITVVLGVVLLLLVAACQPGKNKKYITIGTVDGWAEGIAMTEVVKQILDEQGYNVVTQKATPDMILASMNNQDTDLYLDIWLPLTHGSKVARFPDLVDIASTYDHAKSGLIVPDFVPVNSIEQLNTYADRFGHQIIGIEKGAGLTRATDNTIKDYKLDYRQVNSSTVAMLTELKNAIRENRWIVVAGWQPHWMFGEMKLKFLDDPKKTYGTTETIHIYSRKDFPKEHAELMPFLSQIKFDQSSMSELLKSMEKNKSKEKAVKYWIAQHRSLVNSWVKHLPRKK